MEKIKQTLKSLTALFMIVALVACIMPCGIFVSNADFDEDLKQSGDYLYSITGNNNTALIHSYMGSSKKLTIPSKIDGIKVTGLGESLGYLEVTTIIIPDSVTYIEAGAFTGAPELKSINVSEKNKYYTSVDGVLFNKDKTELVQYPSGKSGTEYTVAKGVTKIGAVSFYGCQKLLNISLADTVESVGNSAFSNCTGIKKFVLPDSVTKIGFNTFGGCTGLESVVIPGGVTVIEHYAFNNCANLKQIYFLGSKEKWEKIAVDAMNEPLHTATVSFTQAPGAVSKIKVNKTTETSLKFSWTKVADASGYKVILYKGKTAVKTIYTTKLTYTFKKLKKGTAYKVKVTAYKAVNGGKVLSEASKTLSTATKVAKPTLSSVKSSKTKQIVAAWKTVSGANGYEISYSTSKKFTKKTTKKVTVSKQKTKKTTIKKLKKGKTYYVKVRAYKTVNGKKIYGAFSKIKTVKVK